jgi:hypothetical protein
VDLSYDEKFILAHLYEGWHLQRAIMRKGSIQKQVPAYAVDSLQEKGLIEPMEVEGRMECCGLSETGRAALDARD